MRPSTAPLETLGEAAPLDVDIAQLLGVCRNCVAKHPQLSRDAHSGMYHEARVADREEDPRARRIRLAKERRRTKRMVRLIQGEHVPVRRSA